MNFTLTAHSKHVILAVVAGLVLLFITYKIVSHFDGTAHDAAILAKAQVEADLQKAKLQATQTNEDKLVLQNQLNSLAASNSALQASVAALRNQLATQRQQNANLTPTDLSARWSMLTGINPVELQPSSNGITASLAASHTTVDALEEIPVLKQEAKDSAANSLEKDKTIESQKKVLADTEAEFETCKKTIVDKDTACKKEVSAVKAAARKHSLITAVGAFVGGILFGRKF